MKDLLTRKIIIRLIIFLGVAITVFISYMFHIKEREKSLAEFNQACEQVVRTIELSLQHPLNVLTSVGSLYKASNFVDRNEFKAFVKDFLSEDSPFQALEWIPRVRQEERKQFEREALNDGHQNFRITELDLDNNLVEASERKEYFPVYYLEPYRGNEQAFGFDLASNSIRLQSLNQARETGELVASSKIQLVQEEKNCSSFLVFNPVYRKNSLLSTSKNRWENLLGFALGVFKTEDLFEQVRKSILNCEIQVVISDSLSSTKEELFSFPKSTVDSVTGEKKIAPPDKEGFRFTQQMVVGKRPWKILCTPTLSRLSRNGMNVPQVVLVIGLGLNLFLYLFLRLLVHQNEEVRRIVKERTTQLDSINCRFRKEIDQRKRTQSSLQQTSDRLFLATQSAKIGVFDWDMEKDHLIWDDQMYQVYGVKRCDFTASYELWKNTIHSEDLDGAEQELKRAIEGKENFDTEFRITWPDESIHTIKAHGVLQVNSSNEPIRMIGVNWDISDSKEAEENLKSARLKAECATEAKSQFLANMSHEIRTPMNGICGMTTLLLETALNAEQKDFVFTIKRSCDSLLSIINEILDFSKIESGKLELENQIFNVRNCVEEALDLVAYNGTSKGLQLAYHIAEEAPELLFCDVTRLRQILVNLLGNAVKFTSKGEVTVAVSGHAKRSLTEKEAEGHLNRSGWQQLNLKPEHLRIFEMQFSVKDTGIGIPSDKISQLFQSFHQVDASTTRKYGGTGLGLSISKRLAELMGGTMWLESTDGCGSTFSFTLSVAGSILSPIPHLSRFSDDLSGKTVILVTDSGTVSKTVSNYLKSWGMEILRVNSSEKACEIVARGQCQKVKSLVYMQTQI